MGAGGIGRGAPDPAFECWLRDAERWMKRGVPGGHSPPRPGWVFWLTKTEAGAEWLICGAGRVRVGARGMGLGAA